LPDRQFQTIPFPIRFPFRFQSIPIRADPIRSITIRSDRFDPLIVGPSHTDFYADFDPIELYQLASRLIRNVMRQLMCLFITLLMLILLLLLLSMIA